MKIRKNRKSLVWMEASTELSGVWPGPDMENSFGE